MGIIDNYNKYRIRIKDYITDKWNNIFSIWQATSWVILLLSYSFLIMAATLFGVPPRWLNMVGITGIYISVINFYITLFVGSIYTIFYIKNKEQEHKTDIYLITFYLFVSAIFYFSVTI